MLSQLLTLYITPVIYTYMDHLGERIGNWRGRGHKHAPAAAE
jgi:multidrug efflux pump